MSTIDLQNLLLHTPTVEKLLAECLTVPCTLMEIDSRQKRLEDEGYVTTSDHYDYLELNSKEALFLTDLVNYIKKLPVRIVEPIDLFPTDVVAESVASAVGWHECPEWMNIALAQCVTELFKKNPHTAALMAPAVHTVRGDLGVETSEKALVADIQMQFQNQTPPHKGVDIEALKTAKLINIPVIGQKTTA